MFNAPKNYKDVPLPPIPSAPLDDHLVGGRSGPTDLDQPGASSVGNLPGTSPHWADGHRGEKKAGQTETESKKKKGVFGWFV